MISKAEWESKVNKFVEDKRQNAGMVTVPNAENTKEEYCHGINNKVVTADIIRRFANAMGDPNPLWRDPAYASTSIWGSIIAPPTFEKVIAYHFAPGMAQDLPSGTWNVFAAGTKHEYFKVIRPGDEFRVIDRQLGIEEKTKAGRPYRLFHLAGQRIYINQRDEVVAIATNNNLITAIPPGEERKAADTFRGAKRHHFTKDELDAIHRAYDEELEGKWRRGANILYWEDVVEGEDLHPVVKGPHDICDAVAGAYAQGAIMAYAVKWELMRTQLSRLAIDPDTGEYHHTINWHYLDGVAQQQGLPYAQSFGAHNAMLLGHVICNWMGDAGFLRKLDDRNVSVNYHGFMSWIKGKVVKKYFENDQHLVDLEVWAENENGNKHTTATATVQLFSRTKFHWF